VAHVTQFPDVAAAMSHLDIQDSVNCDRDIIFGNGSLVTNGGGQLLQRVHIGNLVDLQNQVKITTPGRHNKPANA
jgi:hypothetical protein